MSHRCNEGFTLLELIIVTAVLGILATIAIPNFIGFSKETKVAAVKSNVHTVHVCVEDYGVRNAGDYPATIGAAGADGEALADLLPNGQLLRNPFTDQQSEPIDGPAAAPGQCGYQPIMANGVVSGYTITGYGDDAIAMTVSLTP